MKPSLEQVVAKSIERERLIAPGDRVGVAVSGGADSVALLRLLDAVRARLGVALAVVHFDHNLRAESASDARFAEELARERGLAFIGGQANVASVASRNKWNLEDAARRLRYDFFTDVVSKGQAARIAVAHTMDDQAETVLARVLRGAGPAGLAGIYPSIGVVVRPLLGIRRAALREYLRSLKQEWREDATNRDTARQRARIRENLLPLLERDFSPQAVEHLANLARLSAEESRFWTALVDDRFETLVTQRNNAVSIPIVALLSPLEHAAAGSMHTVEPMRSLTERPLTERLIRRLYQSVRGNLLELTSLHVEQIIHLATGAANGKRIELPGGVRAARNFGELTFSREEKIRTRKSLEETQTPAHAYQYPVRLNDRGATDVSVPELATCFRLKMIDCPSAARETTMWRSILDLDRLRQPLVLRNWQPGDGYRPRGRRKARKLKEMFLAARIAARERLGWPVLESDGRVVWAKGMEPAEDFCAREGTRVGVVIEERKL